MEGTFKYLPGYSASQGNPECSAPPISPQPQAKNSSNHLQVPGVYPSLSPDSATAHLAAGALSTISASPLGCKLKYIDFLPRKLKSNTFSLDEYETFSAVISRINTWLDEHKEAELIQCETVSWFGNKMKEIFSDSTIMARRNKILSNNKIWIQGIRVWYRTDISSNSVVTLRFARGIDCKTVLATKKNEKFSNLVDRINNELETSKYSVQIVNSETVRVFGEVGRADPELMFWTESSSERKVVWALRIYALVRPIQGQDIIRFKDFIPEDRQRTKANKGYEIFSDVAERVASWMFLQQNVRFTNLQTLTGKIKHKLDCTERCCFTEHCKAATRYLKFMRVYYVIARHNDRSEQGQSNPGPWLNCRTFHPLEVKIDGTKKSDEAIFEELRGIIDRISNWLQSTGARLFSIETLKELKIKSKEVDESLPLSEVTYIRDTGKTASYLFHIRVYIQGNYTEPPAATALAVPACKDPDPSRIPPKSMIIADPDCIISPTPAGTSYQPTVLRAVSDCDKSKPVLDLKKHLTKSWRPNSNPKP